ncbi:MAG: MBL fold metallo-hydrolase [Candidatus Aminicenantes bacterium]|nr:MBL fold metallo-hydrolase [Candidatus Aminicenantes bacterium]
MKYETLIVGILETNCYLVYCPETLDCAIVDPGADEEKIFQLITKKNLKPTVILNTHGHIDHIGANRAVKEKFSIPLCIHAEDSQMLGHVQQSELAIFLGATDSPSPDRLIKEGDEIEVSKYFLKVIHTPGHSPGSVCFLGNGFLLSGDTLFFGGVGRTDLPGGSWQELESSIKNKILTLPGDTIVLTGHGPATTVAQEKSSNPFII